MKINLKKAGAKLAKGVPAPSLAEVRALPSKPLNYLIDASAEDGEVSVTSSWPPHCLLPD